MERKIDRKNYKSDLPAVLKLRDARGNEVLFPDCDWEAVFWAFSKGRTYRASCIKGEYTNCLRREDGRICVIFDNHNLGTGVLKWEPHFMFPDALFPDGVRDLYSPEPLDIELVPGRGDDASDVEIEAVLPYIKGDTGEPGKQGEKGERGEKGDPFTFDDFTPEQLAALKGEKGEKGDTGAPGEKGERGDKGEPGAKGDKGDKGDKGNDGAPLTYADLTPEQIEELQLPAKGAARQVFNDMWDAAFGEYGKYDPANAPDAEHPYLGNGIWMTYEEAVNVYNASVTNLRLCLPRNEAYIRQSGLRTVLPFREVKMQLNWQQTFHSCSNLEAVSSFGSIDANNARNMFYNCQKLKKVLSYISLENCASTVDMFYHCYALEYVVFDTINCNISLADSPLWNFESVQKTVERRAAYQTKPITITVNPAVYAKLTGDTTNAAAAALTDEEAAAWQGLVTAAAAKNISFATV